MFSMPFRAGFFGVDQFRYGIEQMHPADYLPSPYYEHWVHTAEHYGVKAGALDPAEIERAHPVLPGAPGRAAARARATPSCWRSSTARSSRGAGRPRVGRGADVRRRRPGHASSTTARWGTPARRATSAARPAWSSWRTARSSTPTAPATAGGDDPEHVYTVRFTNAELWGAGGRRAQRRRLLRRLGALHRPRAPMTPSESTAPIDAADGRAPRRRSPPGSRPSSRS